MPMSRVYEDNTMILDGFTTATATTQNYYPQVR
jgi:hypothetical protein